MLVPQIQEQIVEVIKVLRQERVSKKFVEDILDVSMSQIMGSDEIAGGRSAS